MWRLSLTAFLLAASTSLVSSVQVHNGLSCNKTHIIHIGKTGGTTVHNFLAGLKEEDKPRLLLETHRFLLGEGDPDDCYAFFVRDPVERWVSGFLEGLKTFWRLKKKWGYNKNEKAVWAFDQFGTPNELAEALDSTNSVKHANALECNNFQFHCRFAFAHYLPNLQENLKRIVFVGETRNLEDDFRALCRRLGIAPPELSMAHPHNVCPDQLEWMKKISPKAHANLRRLLHEDYEIMKTLKAAGLIKGTSLHRQGCVRPQERCMLMGDTGEFRMVRGAQSAGSLDIYELPNATKPEELPLGDDADLAEVPEPVA